MTYGYLTVIGEGPRQRTGGKWRTTLRCQCVCGAIKIVRLDALRRGDTKSCGCRRPTGRPRCPVSSGA